MHKQGWLVTSMNSELNRVIFGLLGDPMEGRPTATPPDHQ